MHTVIGRRGLVSTLLSTPLMVAPPADVGRVSYLSTTVAVGGASVPLCVWLPPGCQSSAATSEPTYDYRIDVGRIAQRLGVGWLGWLPAFDTPISRALDSPEEQRRAPGCGLIFAHGFLGSPFDFAHVCERLAAAGFVVGAPELPDSISASYDPAPDTSRASICDAARARLAEDFGVTRWGVLGHSMGAGTATSLPGSYALGRAALCGYRAYEGSDPLLVVASRGDGVIPFERIEETLRAQAGRNVQTLALTEPNHVSFLWAETNDAMLRVLSPFLPLARLLGISLLDFDRYARSRDAEETARDVVPALEHFFTDRV